MKNCIQIDKKQITLDPTNQQEFDACINTCNHILAVMVLMGTVDKKTDKERAEAILNFAGKIGGDIAKRAMTILAKEKAEIQKDGKDA